MKKGLIDSPRNEGGQTPGGSHKGGAGTYNGEPGYPGRTPGAGGPAEKTRDTAGPLTPRKPSKQSY